MKMIGKPDGYHVIIVASTCGMSRYTLFNKHAAVIVSGKRAGTEEEVADYLEQTVLKRYNGGGDNLASEYYNVEARYSDQDREAANVAIA
jgi:hypothetical protein